MKIVPISFHIEADEIKTVSSTDLESSIKSGILKHITKAIEPMLDDESFIDISPSEDGSRFDISLSIIIGSSSEYLDAVSKSTTNLITECENNFMQHADDYDKPSMVEVIQSAISPLVDIIK